MNEKVNTLYDKCLAVIGHRVGYDFLFFDEALRVFDASLWAACASPDGVIYLMDSDEVWYPLSRVSDTSHNLLAILQPLLDKLSLSHQPENA